MCDNGFVSCMGWCYTWTQANANIGYKEDADLCEAVERVKIKDKEGERISHHTVSTRPARQSFVTSPAKLN